MTQNHAPAKDNLVDFSHYFGKAGAPSAADQAISNR
jgi:hypothetical protein